MHVVFKFTVFLALILAPFFAWAQGYYFVTSNGMRVDGVYLIIDFPTINAKKCQQLVGDEIISYSPEQVIEYGFFNGVVHVSKEIEIDGKKEKVFMQRLEDGNISLYSYIEESGKRLFVEVDNQLTELRNANKERDYRALLTGLAQYCYSLRQDAKTVPFHIGAITRFVKLLNNCGRKHFPKPTIGVMAGISSDNIIIPPQLFNELLINADFNSASNVVAGAYFDYPLFANYVSLHQEVMYSENVFYSFEEGDNEFTDILLKLKTIHLPFMVRYTLPAFKIRPYFQTGWIIGFQRVKGSALYNTAAVQADFITTSFRDNEFLGKTKIGFVGAGGVQYRLNQKLTLFSELRYNLYGLAVLNRRVREEKIFIMMGLAF